MFTEVGTELFSEKPLARIVDCIKKAQKLAVDSPHTTARRELTAWEWTASCGGILTLGQPRCLLLANKIGNVIYGSNPACKRM
jgi:hypothetical protein